MGRLGRVIDAGIALIEASIERVADPDRVRYLEEALRQCDRRAAEFAEENAVLNERLERLLREVGGALGVEGGSDDRDLPGTPGEIARDCPMAHRCHCAECMSVEASGRAAPGKDPSQ